MITSNFASEVFKELLDSNDGDVIVLEWGKDKTSILTLTRISSEEVFAEIKHNDISVYQETLSLAYGYGFSELWHVLSQTENRNFQTQVEEINSNVLLSKSEQFNYCIAHFNDYHLNVQCKSDFKVLLNVLEAHGETLEDIGEYTAEAYDYGAETRADAAEHYLECNAFFNSWNDYCESLIDSSNDSIEEFQNYLQEDLLKYSNLAITTDGIVELNVV